MRVLLASSGTRGDVQPLIALGRSLRMKGHQARLCAPSDMRHLAGAHGVEFVELGPGYASWLRARPDLWGGGMRALLALSRLMGPWIDREFSTIEEHCAWAEILVGASLVNAPSSVAEAYRVPFRYAAFCSQAIPSKDHAPFLELFHGLPQRLNPALWSVMDLLLAGMVRGAMNRNRARLGLPPVRSPLRTLLPPGQLILAADGVLSPPPRDYDPDIVETGFWHLPEEERIDADVQEFLDAGPPPVYVTFGSMTDPDPARTTALLVEAAERAKVRALIATGWAGLGGVELPSSCRVVGEVPSLVALFRHLAGVVHHAGAGTTAVAARCGVPQVVVPHAFDQFYRANRVYTVGLAPRPISKRRLTAERLAEALSRLISDAAMRERARRLGAKLGKRDGVAEGVKALEKAVEAYVR